MIHVDCSFPRSRNQNETSPSNDVSKWFSRCLLKLMDEINLNSTRLEPAFYSPFITLLFSQQTLKTPNDGNGERKKARRMIMAYDEHRQLQQ